MKRILDLNTYNQSLFLFGPRQTGKTHLIQDTLKPHLSINLLHNEDFLRYSRTHSLLSKEVKSLHDLKNTSKLLIIIDEIQKCPELLNEVHFMIEELPGSQFILTGSSARKLRKKGVNLLGGRALTLHLYPLTHLEIGDSFQLEEALHFGSMPRIVLAENEVAKKRWFKSYLETYLKEEIQQEALTRNIPAFSRFLELAAFENGNILNWSTLSREVGIHLATIKEYFQILEDTLIGFHLHPYGKSHRTKIVSHPKFYFFDTGIVSALKKQLSTPLIPGTPPFGDAFEHWVILETQRVLDYREREYSMSFFRTTDGAEVDLILEKENKLYTIEIKSKTNPSSRDLKGLRSFLSDHPVDRALCVCQTPRPYRDGAIEYLPWKTFFEEL